MTRISTSLRGVAFLGALAVGSLPVFAQQNIPAAPSAQAPASDVAPSFPPVDPSSFTATTPTKETVNSFLTALWGYDTKRVWQIQAIEKTPVDGVSKVIVLVAEKGAKQTGALQFHMLPDGKHIIVQGEILSFGAHPFAENREILAQRANGPYRNSATKTVNLVEFADFQCPHCKVAQETMNKLAVDYPNAHIAFENYPLVKIHSEALKAAEYSVCIAKQGGNDAFFKFADAAFEGQAGLTPDGSTLTLNSAVTKAGLDPAKVEACSKGPEASAAVDASVKLAQDLNVTETPTLAINGRLVPIGGVPYETLKQIIDFTIQLEK